MDRVSTHFSAGIRDALPLLLGILPFALVAGVAAAETGLSLLQAVGMSVFVFAGASQLAALELLGNDASLAVVVLTAAVINLRMLMYSASIAPHFRAATARIRALLAYFLTDQAFALTVARYDADDSGQRWYYLGVSLALWGVWQVGTVVGVVVGAGVPESWGLEFAVPLVFLALLVPALKNRESLAAGAAAGIVAVVGAGLPFNLGLIVAALVGVAAGMFVEGRR
ncbi:4-azaleucine resistance probable transporter AzlC [Halogranum gelatinilyticum]|uniref:4-azaleucine resistance probable transporter AzlC n=1 Tax=Halogranum gelatinilyticum TaxID=660521 RepID=A0A1G9TZL3_9EURY|nr:AzlC family ABC transporter permease [Halogranum gelatinilyticum]SDM53068.1 4-azaleucine resistance probable transporter AzlC [Halogranum gelatinilyticum]